jgi:hypothetical protein
MPRRILSCLILLGAATPLTGCGTGGGGDPSPKPTADQYGTCPRLSSLIAAPTWENLSDKSSDGCNYPPDQNVCLSGLTLTAIDTFDETGTGAVGDYYVEDTVDDPPPNSGSTIFGPSFSPPDLRLFNGDVVDFLGSLSEFAGPSSPNQFSYCRTLPELEGTVSFRFDGNGTLAPKTIAFTDLLTGKPGAVPPQEISYASARGWLGMLVRLEEVDLAAADASCTNLPTGCRYTAEFLGGLDAKGQPTGIAGVGLSDIPAIANELYDIKNDGPDLSTPKHFKSITGVVTYFYGFHLDPRSPADFEP